MQRIWQASTMAMAGREHFNDRAPVVSSASWSLRSPGPVEVPPGSTRTQLTNYPDYGSPVRKAMAGRRCPLRSCGAGGRR